MRLGDKTEHLLQKLVNDERSLTVHPGYSACPFNGALTEYAELSEMRDSK